MFRFKRLIAALAATVAIAGFTIGNASSASAATSCVSGWSTYSSKTLSTSWSYAGSTARATAVNYYQLRNYCGLPQYRSVTRVTVAQGAYTKVSNANVQWNYGSSTSTSIFPKTWTSPTNTYTRTVAVGFKNARYNISTAKFLTFN